MSQNTKTVHVLTQVADDIYQLQLPLLSAVEQTINCYLLYGNNGWTIVDTGFNTSATRAAWYAAFASLSINPNTIHQIVLTHSHPDHCGAAGWLQQEAGAHPAVYLSHRDAELIIHVWGLPDDQLDPPLNFLRLHGVPGKLARTIAQGVAQLRHLVLPHPVVTPIVPNSTLMLGQRQCVAIHTPGHTDGHFIFYDPADQLLFCGDHVLLDTTSHAGVWPESEPNPLGRYLDSLDALSSLQVRLALPGHGPAITCWHDRLAELEQHHTLRLEQIHQIVAGQRQFTAYDVVAHIRDVATLPAEEILLTVGVVISRLELLTEQALLKRGSSNGAVWYQARYEPDGHVSDLPAG